MALLRPTAPLRPNLPRPPRSNFATRLNARNYRAGPYLEW